jgi:hypothetical protein
MSDLPATEERTDSLTRENGLALAAEAERWHRAYMRERERIFNLRRAIRLAESFLPRDPDAAMRAIERAYAVDDEIEQQVQEENKGNG